MKNQAQPPAAPSVLKRLARMALPYRFWFVAAGISLLFATAAELALPVLLQRTIDRYILAEWSWVSPSLAEQDLWAEALARTEHHSLGGRLFLLSSGMPPLKKEDREVWQKAGLLSRDSWYLQPLGPSLKAEDLPRGPGVLIGPKGLRAAVKKEQYSLLNEETARAFRRGDLQGLKRSSFLYLALLGTILVFTFVQMYAMSWTGQGVMKDLRLKMLSHTMGQSLAYLGDTPVGNLVSRITSDVETINEFFTSVTISVMKDLAVMIGVLVTLFLLNPVLAGITLATLPPILLLTILFRKLARKAYRSQRHWIGKVNAFLSEHVAGMEVIQIFGQEGRAESEFRRSNRALLKASLSEMYVMAFFRPMVDLFTSISLGIVIYAGAGMLQKGLLSLGMLIAFIDLIRKFYNPVMDMSEKFTIMQSAMAGGERVFELLDRDTRLPETGRETLPKTLKGLLEFQNVSFSYKENEPVLKNISFTARPGETIAIVGYTGAGKTTIASLAARLWDIQEGRILLDGRDIRHLPLKELRGKVQAVQQDVFLFSGRVDENISLGSPIPEEQIREAARQVQAAPFIEGLSEGYASPVQERGGNFSAGQRQLLSFARALAHDPEVVILDEATANIDSETETLLQKGLEEILKNRTSLVIAHRLSTIQKADRILVLSQGELVEQGSHEELLARKGLYYTLYRFQYESGGKGA